MDPETTLRELRAVSLAISHGAVAAEDIEAAATELAELVQAMDGWLTRGGYRPADWDRTL